MLNIKDLCISYENKIVFSHFDMMVNSNQVVCISGESGCGKSSILNAILGFIPITSGHITLNNIDLSPSTVDRVRQSISWLPQELSLPSEWVKEMVQLPFLLKSNRHLKYSPNKLLSLFEPLGLEPQLLDKRVSEISGGQRQRIMIAVASLLEKPLLIADEPTSALDTMSALKVIEFFRKQAQGGKAVLLVSHDKQVAGFADQHIIMQHHGNN
jgi:putative ABC transport system ATP-binding protein